MTVKTLLFDINETVLDLKSLAPAFQAIFGETLPLDLWFARLLQSSTVAAITGLKTGFADLARINLEKMIVANGSDPDADKISAFLAGFGNLTPHGDVKPALEALREKGFTTIAFSNSSQALLQKQISNAGLINHFDQLISVEEVGSFKPDPEVYHHAAEKLQQAPEHMMLTAVHDWDVHGALNAGLKGAYLNRGGSAPYNRLYRPPTLEAGSMTELADKIIRLKGAVAK